MTDYSHDEQVEQLRRWGHVSDSVQTPAEGEGQDGTLENPVVDPAVESSEESVDSVEVRYIGHGAYEANGVEVKRNGQVVSVDEASATGLTGLVDDEGNLLFERV